MPTVAEVRLWGRTIAAASLGDGEEIPAFEYDSDFAASGIEISPLVLPLSRRIFSFPSLPPISFHGLPGLLADCLPDRFGNALIEAWLATQGRTSASFNAIERLCYTGSRGMGALEFAPATYQNSRSSTKLEIDALVSLASDVLGDRNHLHESFATDARRAALAEILKVGTSAGGARAKAIIAWNPATNDVRSGQVKAPEGFGYWLLKFDGVTGNRDKEFEDPKGFTVMEYAYSRMARDAGIDMTECRLLEEGGRRHFMTRRFDRLSNGQKLHMQSLAALAHLDFNAPESNSYEQAFDVMRRLGLPMAALEQQFRRMLFNVIARNQDDHVKNIAFLMDKAGRWSLAPAFDVCWSYNPQGRWTSRHQMSINGKRDDFVMEDFRACAATAGLARGRTETMVDEILKAVVNWADYADDAGLAPTMRDVIAGTLRLTFPRA
ncbi:MAG TPA: type II toxin-antitoxin system HipA family toxin [Steroidobacteraceae bacterium]